MRSIKNAIQKMINSDQRFISLSDRGFYWWLSDEEFLVRKYRCFFHKDPNLENPVTFNEKILWQKLYDHNPLYTKLADKVSSREYTIAKIGEDHLIPMIGVWDDVQEIDFDSLPDRFLLKCSHDSGSVVFCLDKRHFSIAKAKRHLTHCMNQNYYLLSREWQYKNIPHRVIAEPFLADSSQHKFLDYKFMCFNAIPKLCVVVSDVSFTGGKTKETYYDMDFNFLPIRACDMEYAPEDITRPKTFNEMKEIASKLSEGLPQVRIDLYDIDGKIYLGEYTFTHDGGNSTFTPPEWDYRMGEWWTLPEKTLETS